MRARTGWASASTSSSSVARVVARLQDLRAEAVRQETAARQLLEVTEVLVADRPIVELFERVVTSLTSTFSLRGAALYLSGDHGLYRVAIAGEEFRESELTALLPSAGRPTTFEVGAGDRRSIGLTLSVGSRPVGLLLLAGVGLRRRDWGRLQTYANQLAVALDRQVLRDQALRAELLEEVDALRDALMGAVSHDLRTPLASITAAASALNDREAALSVRDRVELGELIESQAKRLARLVTNILDMTRIEDGRLKLSPRRLPLGPLLTEVAEEYGALARAQGVSVAVEAPSGMADAAADPDRTRQVLHNLLSNALKFTPSGRSVHLSAGAEGARLCIDVRDEGVGVPPAMREKLFGKFSRLSPALDDTEGTGLGLYISRRLVEAQGGRLTYEPGPDGRGSHFRVTLPRAADAS